LEETKKSKQFGVAKINHGNCHELIVTVAHAFAIFCVLKSEKYVENPINILWCSRFEDRKLHALHGGFSCQNSGDSMLPLAC
jgi:hypothetical protein